VVRIPLVYFNQRRSIVAIEKGARASGVQTRPSRRGGPVETITIGVAMRSRLPVRAFRRRGPSRCARARRRRRPRRGRRGDDRLAAAASRGRRRGGGAGHAQADRARRDRARQRPDRHAHCHAVSATMPCRSRGSADRLSTLALPRHRGFAAVEVDHQGGRPIAGGRSITCRTGSTPGHRRAGWGVVKKGETARELWERALAPLGSGARAGDRSGKRDGRLPAKPQGTSSSPPSAAAGDRRTGCPRRRHGMSFARFVPTSVS